VAYGSGGGGSVGPRTGVRVGWRRGGLARRWQLGRGAGRWQPGAMVESASGDVRRRDDAGTAVSAG
jgi:hypothetical protein